VPVGLPEDSAIRDIAFSLGFAFISIDSENTCWDSKNKQKGGDLEAVKSIVDSLDWVDGENLYGIGTSSGGSFVMALAGNNMVKFKGIIVQIMALPMNRLSKFIENLSLEKYPSTVFMHMTRDKGTASRVT